MGVTQYTDHSHSPTLENLRSLLIIRSIALLGQIGVLGYVLLKSRTTEDLLGMTVSLAGLATLTMVSLWRCGKGWPVSDGEFLLQLMLDVLIWTALMYFTGGANNPFVSYYIVPLVISAAVLPWRFTWLVAATSLGAYSLLLYYYRPFPLFTPHASMGHGSGTNIHILGMWFNFLFSAGLITYFVVRMAAQLRIQEARAIAQREQRLRSDQIMAVASLAAGTAHELGTPLSTMTVLVDEMLADESLSRQSREDCQLLQEKIHQCRETLNDLSRTAELNGTDEVSMAGLGHFASQTVKRWAVRRPSVSYQLTSLGKGPTPEIAQDPTLGQALENLLNNGADAGSEQIAVSYDWTASEARIEVRDWGSGINPQLLEDIGKPIIRASGSGLGIGLLISHATVERYGGRIELQNAPERGAIATMYLPLGRIRA
jgi:two-component system, sensor histidine kinase RegB